MRIKKELRFGPEKEYWWLWSDIVKIITEDRDLSLNETTEEFFDNLRRFLVLKYELDQLYRKKVRSPERILESENYKSFGTAPMQKANAMTVEELLELAALKKPAIDEFLLYIVMDVMKLDPDEKITVNGAPVLCGSKAYKVLMLAPLKSAERCHEKAKNEYKNDAKRLVDVVRATIVCRTEEEIARAIDVIKKRVWVVRMKNIFVRPLYTGLRYIILNIEFEDFVFELQIHQKDIVAIKEPAHEQYEFFRKYFAGEDDSYKKRMELLDKLGEAFRNKGNVLDAILFILEGTDIEKLFYLSKLTTTEIFPDPDLRGRVWKRLLKLCNGPPEAASLRKYADVRLKSAGSSSDDLDKATRLRCLDKATRLRCLYEIACAHKDRGGYPEAVELYKKTLEGEKSLLGSDHESTLSTSDNLAGVYRRQGKYKDAEAMYEEILEIQKATLVPDHPSMLTTMNNLALALKQQQNYDRAMELFEEVYEKQKLKLSENDPDTLATLNNLAQVHTHQENYDTALKLYKEVLRGQKAALGIHHPHTLSTMNDIAVIHDEQQNYNTAMKLYREILEIQKSKHGRNHPTTLKTMFNMATCYYEQGDNHRALKLFREVLEGKKLALGDDHLSTLLTKGWIEKVTEELKEQANENSSDQSVKCSGWHL